MLMWPLRSVGADLLRYGRPADAVPVLRELVAVAEADAKAGKKLGPEVVSDARRLLGLALLPTTPNEAAKLLAEAHPPLAAAVARAEAGGLNYVYVTRDELRQLVQSLIDHHTAAGRPEEAAAWRAKRPAEVAPPPRPKPEK